MAKETINFQSFESYAAKKAGRMKSQSAAPLFTWAVQHKKKTQKKSKKQKTKGRSGIEVFKNKITAAIP